VKQATRRAAILHGMQVTHKLFLLLREICRDLDGDVSLRALSERTRYSCFHLHRLFVRVLGEPPKQYTSRVRLERAAAKLAAGDEHVMAVALAAGFASHEVFTRAFRRRFGCSPTEYRAAALAGASPAERTRHAEISDRTAPCIGLYRFPLAPTTRRPFMS